MGLPGEFWGGALYLLSFLKPHTQFRWKLTTTFISPVMFQSLFTALKENIHRCIHSSPLHSLWFLHAYQWLSGNLIQPRPGERPGIFPRSIFSYPATKKWAPRGITPMFFNFYRWNTHGGPCRSISCKTDIARYICTFLKNYKNFIGQCTTPNRKVKVRYDVDWSRRPLLFPDQLLVIS